VRAARNVGLTLDEIAAARATLPDGRTPTRADWVRLSRGWQARLDEQIAALRALREDLGTCIGCGCLSLRRCALSNPSDSAGGAGATGAAYLPAALRRN
jgi:MerR family redox-sensitive transcriptional activator SoxR